MGTSASLMRSEFAASWNLIQKEEESIFTTFANLEGMRVFDELMTQLNIERTAINEICQLSTYGDYERMQHIVAKLLRAILTGKALGVMAIASYRESMAKLGDRQELAIRLVSATDQIERLKRQLEKYQQRPSYAIEHFRIQPAVVPSATSVSTDHLIQVIDQLNRDLQERNDQCWTLRDSYERSIRDLDEANRKGFSLSDRISQLEATNTRLTEAKAIVEDNLKMANSQVASLQGRLLSKEPALQASIREPGRFLPLDKGMDNVKSESDPTLRERHLNDKLDKMTAVNSVFEGEKIALKQTLQKVKEERERLIEEAQKLKLTLASVEQEREELRRQLQDKSERDNRLRETEREIKRLKQELQESAERLRQEEQRTRQEELRTRQEVDKLSASNKSLNEDKNTMGRELDQGRRDREELERRLRAAAEESQQQQRELDELRPMRRTLEAMESESLRLKNRLQQSDRESAHRQELREELTAVQREKKAAEERLGNVEQELQEARSEINRVRNLSRSEEERRRQSEITLSEERTRFERELSAIKRELSKSNRQSAEYETTITSMKEELLKANEKIVEQRNESNSLQNRLKSSKENEEREKTRLAAEIKIKNETIRELRAEKEAEKYAAESRCKQNSSVNYEAQIEQLSDELKNMTNQNARIKQQLRVLAAENEKLKQANITLSVSLEQSDYEKFIIQKRQLEQELEAANEQLAEKREFLARKEHDYQQAYLEHQGQIRDRDRTIQDLLEKIDSLEAKLGSFDD